MLPGRLSLRLARSSKAMASSCLCSASDFGFADPEKRTQILVCILSRISQLRCSLPKPFSTDPVLADAQPSSASVKHSNRRHDGDSRSRRLFMIEKTGWQILLDHCFHRANRHRINSCKVMPAFTSLTQTACAQFFRFVQYPSCGRRTNTAPGSSGAESSDSRRGVAPYPRAQTPRSLPGTVGARDPTLARLRDHCADPDTLCRRCRVPGLACQLKETCKHAHWHAGNRSALRFRRTPPQNAQQLPVSPRS